MRTLESNHSLSPEIVLENLTDNLAFRKRLHFEMNDLDDLVTDNRNFNFKPHIEGFPKEVRLFQNDKIKYNDDVRILVSKYVFSFDGKQYFLKTVRRIDRNPDGTSHSTVEFNDCAIKNQKLDQDLKEPFLRYLETRCQKQNALLSEVISSLVPAGQLNSNSTCFQIPFNQVFKEFRSRVTDLSTFVRNEHEIDPSITNAVKELDSLRNEINNSHDQIMEALHHRDEVLQRIHQQNQQIIEASHALQDEINRPQSDVQLTDSNNDVAFAFTLIPLIVAIVGVYMKKKE